MNIEEVAAETPSEIYKEGVDIITGDCMHACVQAQACECHPICVQACHQIKL